MHTPMEYLFFDLLKTDVPSIFPVLPPVKGSVLKSCSTSKSNLLERVMLPSIMSFFSLFPRS